MSVMYGLAGAMDTLCGQAYGRRNFHSIGIVAQRACLVMCAFGVPLVLAWTHLKQPAILLGLSPEIVDAASRYMLWITPQLPLCALTAVIHKFQTSQVHFLICQACLLLWPGSDSVAPHIVLRASSCTKLSFGSVNQDYFAASQLQQLCLNYSAVTTSKA